MASEYTHRFEHCIYVPVLKFDTDTVRQVAEECGGCTVIYNAGGAWIAADGTCITEPVNIISTLTEEVYSPLTFDAIEKHLLAHGEEAVLTTRRLLSVAGI